MSRKVVIGVLLLVSVAMFFYGLTQQIAAEREVYKSEQLRKDLAKCEEMVRTERENTEKALTQVQQLAIDLQKAIEAASKKK